MKPFSVLKAMLFSFIVYTCLPLAGCNDVPKVKYPDLTRADTGKYMRNQLVVFYKNGNDATHNAFRNSIQRRRKDTFTVIPCACGINLELWQGANIESLFTDTSIIKTEETRVLSKTGVSGSDTVIFSYNTKYGFPGGDSAKNYRLPFNAIQSLNQRKVKVAVLDTGLDTTFFESNLYSAFLMTSEEAPGCGVKAPGKFGGWNFVNNNANYEDNHKGRHGTQVTGLALMESQKNTIKILPVKTHNEQGIGLLFDMLCGMKYAQKAQVNFINASWGEYGDENLIFTAVLKELINSKIVLIAAAGNDGKDITQVADYFYPACYSNRTNINIENVISVTTSDKNGHCSNNNFSSKRVDVGVSGKKDSCGFRSPFQPSGSNIFIHGSSFATAVMTGLIADNFPYDPGSPLNEKVLDHLPTASGSIMDVRKQKRYRQH